MPKSSWLAKAKTVHDLGHPVYLPEPGQAWDDARQDRVDTKWSEFIKRPLPVSETDAPFFGTRMHDSWVMGINQTPEKVTVRLDSIEADIFVIDLCAELGIERIPSQWPVELICHQPVYVRAARHDPYGNLRFEDTRKIRSAVPQTGDEFLYDWFFEQDGRIQWIAEICSIRPERGKLSMAVYLMVDCARCTALDLRGNAIEKVYGQNARTIWNEVLRGSDDCTPYQGIWAFGRMREFIRGRIDRHGFERSPRNKD